MVKKAAMNPPSVALLRVKIGKYDTKYKKKCQNYYYPIRTALV